MSPLDIVVLLKICAKRGSAWSQRDLAQELYIALGSVSNSLNTAEKLKLFIPSRKLVNVKEFEEALVYGSRYFLPPKRGGEARGMPTGWAAPPLRDELALADQIVPVWPDPNGESRGIRFEPLHPSVPKAARLDPLLYELLALVDSLRDGGARERKLAERDLHIRLQAQ